MLFSFFLFGVIGNFILNNYDSKRFSARISGLSLLALTVMIVMLTVPYAYAYIFTYDKFEKEWTISLDEALVSFAAFLGTLSGTATAVIGLFSGSGSSAMRTVSKLFFMTVGPLFIYFVFVIGFHLSILIQPPTQTVNALISPLVLTLLFFGLCPDINHTGLHRFYRDQLMELFMPGENSIRAGRPVEAATADHWMLKDVWPPSIQASEEDGKCALPYPIFNTNLILGENSGRNQIGTNFILSPMAIGSDETGWKCPEEALGREGTVASAIAISGAAVNPGAGFMGSGVAVGGAAALAMTLLNLRLSAWIRNPFFKGKMIFPWPNQIFPIFWYWLKGAPKEGKISERAWLELSDGGHFDNSGLYELFRRKTKIIVAVDAEADRQLSFISLENVLAMAKERFNVDVDWGDEKLEHIQKLMPKSETGYADSPYMIGKLDYNDGNPGILIYIKATRLEVPDLGVYTYSSRHPEFPHQSTVDQFFDEKQFEAYRLLGIESAKRAIDKFSLDSENLKVPSKIISNMDDGDSN